MGNAQSQRKEKGEMLRGNKTAGKGLKSWETRRK
jgi:hypothetical protein